jgi:hypothetical protein
LASFIGIVAVPLTPSLEHGVLHIVAVLAGALPGIAAGILANVLLARSPHRNLLRLGVALLLASAVDAALYVQHVASTGPPVLALPVFQRVALTLLLAWLVGIAVTLLRQRPR